MKWRTCCLTTACTAWVRRRPELCDSTTRISASSSSPSTTSSRRVDRVARDDLHNIYHPLLNVTLPDTSCMATESGVKSTASSEGHNLRMSASESTVVRNRTTRRVGLAARRRRHPPTTTTRRTTRQRQSRKQNYNGPNLVQLGQTVNTHSWLCPSYADSDRRKLAFASLNHPKIKVKRLQRIPMMIRSLTTCRNRQISIDSQQIPQQVQLQ